MCPPDRPDVQAARPSLRLQRRFPVGPEKVWRAWTDPQALSRWFGPGDMGSVDEAHLDVRQGGRYHVGFHTPDGERHDVSGVYEEVDFPRRLVFSWAWKSTPERVSRVTVTLTPEPDGTALELLHERFYDEAARDGHLRGWPPTLDKLVRHIGEAG